MPVNIGYAELYALQSDGELRITVQYDNTGPADPAQPLIDRDGACLRATNTTPRVLEIVIADAAGGDDEVLTVAPGGPDLAVPAAQLRALGMQARGDIERISSRQVEG